MDETVIKALLAELKGKYADAVETRHALERQRDSIYTAIERQEEGIVGLRAQIGLLSSLIEPEPEPEERVPGGEE